MVRISFLVATFSAFLITAISGYVVIPWLRKLKYGQTINEIGPTWHQTKQGTPTMGGIMFVIGILVGVICGYSLLLSSEKTFMEEMYRNQNMSLLISMLTAMAFGLIGFVDDYIKVVKKRNLGLTEKQKLVLQFFVTAAFLVAQYLIGHINTNVNIPVIGHIELGILYYPIVFAGIIFMVNAVNLTDGIDGLCSSVTFIVALSFFIISVSYGYYANSIFACALAGALAGFLVWNFYPAKVFMGDTGSMFLGGSVVAMAWAVNRPEILVLIGIIYTCEALSVVIQMTYFKITHGKRIFKMSPIHHHYEMSGWSEIKIVCVFSAVAAVFGALSYVYMYLG
ncbi:MAG: phospho-N-acetylmuramoyl-pentapeptide-transferase [Oscillospiraceae bacterium]|nr:phospho-N-acetylmuramoyl-pentapeptide-transferase [Oscillospiraceae bacterium]MBR2504222.1 phospho-N-acetylmuramoyl-pentapeptide-transferase [Oscillospiraceae bacterium]